MTNNICNTDWTDSKGQIEFACIQESELRDTVSSGNDSQNDL